MYAEETPVWYNGTRSPERRRGEQFGGCLWGESVVVSEIQVVWLRRDGGMGVMGFVCLDRGQSQYGGSGLLYA
jgi:hypothetical protein